MFSCRSLSQDFHQLAASHSVPHTTLYLFVCSWTAEMSSKLSLCRVPLSEIPQLHLQRKWAGIRVRGRRTWTFSSSESKHITRWVQNVSSCCFSSTSYIMSPNRRLSFPRDYCIWTLDFSTLLTFLCHPSRAHGLTHAQIVGTTCVTADHWVPLKMHALNIRHVHMCVISRGARARSEPQSFRATHEATRDSRTDADVGSWICCLCQSN